LKSKVQIIGLTIILIIVSNLSVFSQTTVSDSVQKADSLKILTQYSLFSEYYKNKDYKSALPFGWKVIQLSPKKFAKWVYFKMEDALWYEHDSTNAAPAKMKTIEDTLDYLYNLAIEYDTKDRGYFEARKAYIEQNWMNENKDTVIHEYEDAIRDDSTIPDYYYDQLGQLYASNANNNNDYKQKAIELYEKLSEKEPNNQVWPTKLESLVSNIKDLVSLTKKNWDLDHNNLAKAWKYAELCMKANMYKEAVTALNFLVTKSPNNANYWVQLADAYQLIKNLLRLSPIIKIII
jgi:tetratricopeptide (TPR) repeat protein